MSSSPHDLQIHVRFRGNVFGPFTPDELRDLVRRGRSASTWEISLDRQTWRPIGELETLVRSACLPLQFDVDKLPATIDENGAPSAVSVYSPGQSAPGSGTSEGTNATSPGTGEALWYYADGEEHVGPVPESRIIALIREGVLKASSLVWTLNMETWRPVSETRLRRVLPKAVAADRTPMPMATGDTPVPSLPSVSGISVSLNRDRLKFGLVALACIAGVCLLLKLLLLPSSGGGLHLLAELSECGVLVGLILVALAGQAWLNETFPTERARDRIPGGQGQDDVFPDALP
ncbi:GYF domain-containing protein [Thermogutta sp.]|uniref:GYF domain-containing protein n=1 Tax=Thermogutta sp. TaxID=1962930 RepID=UPI003C7C4B00